MSDAICLVVEGEGEVEAVPALIRRLLYEHFQRYEFQTLKSFNVKGVSNIDKPGGLEYYLNRIRSFPNCKGVIVLRDAERAHCDCPPDLAHALAVRAQTLGLPFPVAIVCATCEYESWFLASLESIKANFDGLKPDATFDDDPEQECNAKEWLTYHMIGDRAYKETTDQVTMTRYLDILHTLEHSRSFKRLVHAVEELLRAIDSETIIVTPSPPTNDHPAS